MALDIEAEIHARIAAMEAEPQASVAPEDVRREILFVHDAVHTTGVESRGGLRPLTQIELSGIATPSSFARRGILRFRATADLKPPYYNDLDRTIRVWLDISHLDHVLYQLNHRKRYLWIGIWPDGYTYADLHSRP
ncbi:hypothetical protein [Pseudooceanicola onchidii]|uniref:hypothetical protein n=1 Tax=Pseudooceanicola onchidii TaxID=2562279 RepID=UPI0010AA4740|nr:hypothetical protein [Pseudooceanicola onchidii]